MLLLSAWPAEASNGTRNAVSTTEKYFREAEDPWFWLRKGKGTCTSVDHKGKLGLTNWKKGKIMSIDYWFEGKQVMSVDEAFSLLLENPLHYVTVRGIWQISLQISVWRWMLSVIPEISISIICLLCDHWTTAEEAWSNSVEMWILFVQMWSRWGHVLP